MKNIRPLDDLEMFELISAAYPDKFQGDDDDTWDAVQEFANELNGWDDIAELIGRVVMLAMPMESAITKRKWHCLGKVKEKEGQIYMESAVSREFIATSK